MHTKIEGRAHFLVWTVSGEARALAPILSNVGFKHLATAEPPGSVEVPFLVKAIDRGVSHRQAVVRVVVGEQPLAAEGEQTGDALDRFVDPAEVSLVTLLIDRVGLGQTPREHL